MEKMRPSLILVIPLKDGQSSRIAQNGKYNDGVAGHDVACHTRSDIVFKEPDQFMSLVNSQDDEEVKKEPKISIDSVLAIEIEPLRLNVLTPPPVRYPLP